MDYVNHDLLHSLSGLGKYFQTHKKSEVLASGDAALKSLQNKIMVRRQEPDTTLNKCKWSKRDYRRRFKKQQETVPPIDRFKKYKEPVTPIYYINQAGEITNDEDEDDPDQLVLA